MKAKRTAKTGTLRVVSSAFAAWILLAAQPAQAQRGPTPPNCPSSSMIRTLTDGNAANGELTDDITIDAFTTEDLTGGGSTEELTGLLSDTVPMQYFRIQVPSLTVGNLELRVSGALGRSVGRLCRGTSTIATHPTTATADTPDHFSITEPVTPGDYYVVVRGQNVAEDGMRLDDPETGAYTLTVIFSGITPATGTSAGGSFTRNNEEITHSLITSDPGLLTVRTIGTQVDTIGMLGSIQSDDNGGSGNNFEIVSPVDASDDATDTFDVAVTARPRDARGDYTLEVDFKVAENLGSTAAYADATRDNDDNEMIERGRGDYYFFTASDRRFLTVQTQTPTTSSSTTDTTGTLFSTSGLVATDTNSGAGNNFLLRAPISSGNYILEVAGATSSTAGPYNLVATSEVATVRATVPTSTMMEESTSPSLAAGGRDVRSIDVGASGTLQVETTGSVDTVGVLYGPDGRQIATDDNSGDGTNFRITAPVMPGQYIVEVEGQAADTMGDYQLRVNFIEGATVGTGPVGDVEELQMMITALEMERDMLRENLMTCEAPVPTNARGVLGNPPNGSIRSGIGVISGWVCSANDVEVRIDNNQGRRQQTLNVAYGTSRPDTVGECQHNSPDTGFGMTFNYNSLDEGTYTIRAFADGQQIGRRNTFTVVHLEPFEAADTDRFIRDLEGECSVSNFPEAGDTTTLEWEQSIQNFVITDVE